MFLMYNEKLPTLYIRTPLSIGPGLCELLRISLLRTRVHKARNKPSHKVRDP